MAHGKKKRKPGRLVVLADRRSDVTVGVFAMAPCPKGKPRRVRVEFPAKLTTQEKYDVATSLAKAAGKLVAEADEENRALLAESIAEPEVEPHLRIVPR